MHTFLCDFSTAVGVHVEDKEDGYLPACAVCGRSCGCWPVWTSGSSAENLQANQTSVIRQHTTHVFNST